VSKTGIEERRAHPRHTASIEMQGSHEDGGVVARMITRDLSLGGLYCTSTTDFAEMTRLAVRLMLPIDGEPPEGQPLDVEAVVVRREVVPAVNGNSRYDLALYFTNLDSTARDRLCRYLGTSP